MQFHDHPQHVTIGISSDDAPAGVRLQSAGFRVLECMPQVGERDAALLHRSPSMIINEDSAAPRKGPDSALRFRSLHLPDDSARLGILSTIDGLPIISWTRSGQSRLQPAQQPSLSARQRAVRTMKFVRGNRSRPSGSQDHAQTRRPHRVSTDGADRNWLRGQDLNLRPSGYEGGSTQPADGRRHSCFQSLRELR